MSQLNDDGAHLLSNLALHSHPERTEFGYQFIFSQKVRDLIDNFEWGLLGFGVAWGGQAHSIARPLLWTEFE